MVVEFLLTGPILIADFTAAVAIIVAASVPSNNHPSLIWTRDRVTTHAIASQ
jgi:hypothetical protein